MSLMSTKFAPVKILSIIDDILTYNFVDHLVIDTKCSKVHDLNDKLFDVQIKEDLKLAIIRKTSNYKKIKDYRSAAMGIASIYKKQLKECLNEDEIKTYFVEHLCRYLAIFSQHSGIELVNTYRYKGIPEVTVIATKSYKKGDIIPMVEGTWGVMNPEENEEFKRNECDFSVMYSSVKKTYNVFLGPPRFINHDCNNNVEYYREGTKVLLRATKYIEKGAEIFTSYGEEYFRHRSVDKNGVETFHNDCKCDSCRSGFNFRIESSRKAKVLSKSKTAIQYSMGENYENLDKNTSPNGTYPANNNYFKPQDLVSVSNIFKCDDNLFDFQSFDAIKAFEADLSEFKAKNKETNGNDSFRQTGKENNNHPSEMRACRTETSGKTDAIEYNEQKIQICKPVRLSESIITGLESAEIKFWNLPNQSPCGNCKSSTFQSGYEYNFDGSRNTLCMLLARSELINAAHVCNRCFKHNEIFDRPWPAKMVDKNCREEDEAVLKRYGVLLNDALADSEECLDFEKNLHLYKAESNYYRIALKRQKDWLLFKDFKSVKSVQSDFVPFLDLFEDVAKTVFFIEPKEWDVMQALIAGKTKFNASTILQFYLRKGLPNYMERWYDLRKFNEQDQVIDRKLFTASSYWNYKINLPCREILKVESGSQFKALNNSILGEMVWLDPGMDQSVQSKQVFWPGIIAEIDERSTSLTIYHFDQTRTANVPLQDVFVFDDTDDMYKDMQTREGFDKSWVKLAIKCYTTGELDSYKMFNEAKSKFVMNERNAFLENLRKGNMFIVGEKVKVHTWTNRVYNATVLRNTMDGLVEISLEDGQTGLVEAQRISKTVQ
eukprot:NODE_558_length_6689_cov_0.361912.p1 type:complete len:831 gc:universal NODE_558_length_6689_cov_0.361912:3560-1068(-)